MTIDTATPVFLPADLSQTVAEIVRQVDPSVVQVRVDARGGGAGFVWGEGLVMTNQHVVGNAETAEVQFPDGNTYTGRVVASTQALDLALLRLDAANLPQLPVAAAAAPRVGELVIAIGHPWGQRGVVTMGIVSGIGEIAVNELGRKAQYIRSDVRLAPGNSGGPMLNARGEVVGINAMIFGGDLSVAIPAQVAVAWAEGAESRRPVTLGVELQPVAVRGAQRSAGLLITAIADGSLAEAGGLMVGDVLLEINGNPAADQRVLRDALSLAPGGLLDLAILRGGALQSLQLDPGQARRL